MRTCKLRTRREGTLYVNTHTLYTLVIYSSYLSNSLRVTCRGSECSNFSKHFKPYVVL